MLSLKYSVSKEEYIDYYTYVLWDAPDRKKKQLVYYTRQLLINGGVIALIYFTDLFNSQKIYLYLYIGVLVLMTAVQIFSARNRVKKQAEKITENEGNSSIFLETEAQFSETGIIVKDVLKETKFNWNAFTRKQENERSYFLFINTVQALIIPKRIFRSAVEKEQFEKLLSQYLSFDAELGHLVKS